MKTLSCQTPWRRLPLMAALTAFTKSWWQALVGEHYPGSTVREAA